MGQNLRVPHGSNIIWFSIIISVTHTILKNVGMYLQIT